MPKPATKKPAPRKPPTRDKLQVEMLEDGDRERYEAAARKLRMPVAQFARTAMEEKILRDKLL